MRRVVAGEASARAFDGADPPESALCANAASINMAGAIFIKSFLAATLVHISPIAGRALYRVVDLVSQFDFAHFKKTQGHR